VAAAGGEGADGKNGAAAAGRSSSPRPFVGGIWSAQKRVGGGAAMARHGDFGESCAPGEATKACCMAATGHACRLRSPAASAPPHVGSGAGKSVAAAQSGKPGAAKRDAAGAAVGVTLVAPMVKRQPMPRRGRARQVAHVATAAPPGAR